MEVDEMTEMNKSGKNSMSQVAPVGKTPPTKSETQDTRVWSWGWEDALEEEIAIYSSVLAWRIAWTEASGGLQSTSITESDMTEGSEQASTHA